MPARLGIPTTVLIAPDSFKGTFTAAEVAAAIGRGLEEREVPVDLCPVADGGEGTLAALAGPLELELRTAPASDPLGRPVQATFGLGDGFAIVETAAASGLGLVAEPERDPIAASTYGTGELLAAAIDAGARTVYLGVGGSATSDGGAGALRALRERGGVRGARVIVLCDVRTPFEDAARVFGPQKGADPRQVAQLTSRLHALARQLERDPRGMPMTGAAGGRSSGCGRSTRSARAYSISRRCSRPRRWRSCRPQADACPSSSDPFAPGTSFQ
jgi:glycerate kinase